MSKEINGLTNYIHSFTSIKERLTSKQNSSGFEYGLSGFLKDNNILSYNKKCFRNHKDNVLNKEGVEINFQHKNNRFITVCSVENDLVCSEYLTIGLNFGDY